MITDNENSTSGGAFSKNIFGRLLIKGKLIAIIMFVSSTAMLLAMTAFIIYERISFSRHMISDLSTHAYMIADNCTGALSFNDPHDAEEVLKSLQGKKPIAYACIFENDGAIFATYQRSGFTIDKPPVLEKEGFNLGDGWLTMYKQITINDKPAGTVFLQSDLRDLNAFVRKSVIALVVMIVLTSLFAFILSSRLQKIISRPIFHLADIAGAVSKKENYGVRATKQSDDEIGMLTDTFNDMLGQVEKRDLALRNSEERFRSLVETTSDWIWEIDSKGIYTYASPKVIDLLGYSPEEIIGKTPEDIMPEKERERIRKIHSKLLETRSPIIALENINIHKDGHRIVLETNGVPVFDEKGDFLGYRGIDRDITARKKDEEEKRHLQNMLTNIINSMPSILVGVDAEGRITQWNKEAENATGTEADQALGKSLDKVFPLLSKEMGKIRQTIQQRETQKDSKISYQVNGETRFSDITVYPLISNGLEGAVIRVDDVTERVRIEEMMIQSEKMLSVGGLAAGMAHEINNPLAGILQNLQVMRNRMSDENKKNIQAAQECGTSIENIKSYMEKRGIFTMVGYVMESGKRASKIVNNMLSFSRKSESLSAPENLGDLLDKTIELAETDYDLKKMYDFRQVEIIRQYDQGMPQVKCESSKIQQVILNILKNGAEAMVESKDPTSDHKQRMTEGEDEISIPRFTMRVMQDGKMARIEIEDNGPGMDKETSKRVFEPFFTTKGVGIGTGLGLSVSYFIITENHDGKMSVESTPGKGTKFIIHLPL